MSWPKDILPLDLLWSYVTKKDRLYFTLQREWRKSTKRIYKVFSFIHWWNGHKSMFLPRGVRTLKNVSKLFDDRHDTHYVSTEIISCKKYHVIYNLWSLLDVVGRLLVRVWVVGLSFVLQKMFNLFLSAIHFCFWLYRIIIKWENVCNIRFFRLDLCEVAVVWRTIFSQGDKINGLGDNPLRVIFKVVSK